MDNIQNGISPYTVNLSASVLKQMITVVHDLQQLSEAPNYSNLLNELPATAKVKATHYSVMMAYDFHIDAAQQAKLIEVNTNAGGLWFACRSYQPEAQSFPQKLGEKLLATFLQDYRLFRQDPSATPKLIAIIDQDPQQQFLYPEMQVFAALFEQAGIKTVIIDPSQIDSREQHLYYQNQAIDLIYNRHCDFYLASDAMQPVAAAWQQQTVCLTPNPQVYCLLADKQRMVDWSMSDILTQILPEPIATRLQRAIPKTQILGLLDRQEAWAARKQKVFKPMTSYASRGVYIGKKLTKTKFNSLDFKKTLVQDWVKPTITQTEDGEQFKTDFRLFVYRNTILNVSARLYQGQVTNLRTHKGGFSKIKIIA
ncbi:MAG: hypothetical protein GQ582_04780 [Methyloprofundus sp.]|nr:hypothetical protein [Methyloprofundus sp.]